MRKERSGTWLDTSVLLTTMMSIERVFRRQMREVNFIAARKEGTRQPHPELSRMVVNVM